MTDLNATTGTWALDVAHTRLGFSAKHAMVTTVRGSFNAFEGTLVLDGSAPQNSKAVIEIQADSFSSGNEQRDGHVKSPDFLDAENYPTLSFTSTSVTHSVDEFEVSGDLTIKGTTQPVTIKAELEGVSTDPFGNDRIGFSGETTISRKDFGLTFNVPLDGGGVLVSDKVKITLDVSAIKQA